MDSTVIDLSFLDENDSETDLTDGHSSNNEKSNANDQNVLEASRNKDEDNHSSLDFSFIDRNNLLTELSEDHSSNNDKASLHTSRNEDEDNHKPLDFSFLDRNSLMNGLTEDHSSNNDKTSLEASKNENEDNHLPLNFSFLDPNNLTTDLTEEHGSNNDEASLATSRNKDNHLSLDFSFLEQNNLTDSTDKHSSTNDQSSSETTRYKNEVNCLLHDEVSTSLADDNSEMLIDSKYLDQNNLSTELTEEHCLNSYETSAVTSRYKNEVAHLTHDEILTSQAEEEDTQSEMLIDNKYLHRNNLTDSTDRQSSTNDQRLFDTTSNKNKVDHPLHYEVLDSPAENNSEMSFDSKYLTMTLKADQSMSNSQFLDSDVTDSFINETLVTDSLIIGKTSNDSAVSNSSTSDEMSFCSTKEKITSVPISPTNATMDEVVAKNEMSVSDLLIIGKTSNDSTLSNSSMLSDEMSFCSTREKMTPVPESPNNFSLDQNETIIILDATLAINENLNETLKSEFETHDKKQSINHEDHDLNSPIITLNDTIMSDDSQPSAELSLKKCHGAFNDVMLSHDLSPIIEEGDQTSSFPTLTDTEEIVRTALKRQSSKTSSLTRKLPTLPTKHHQGSPLTKTPSIKHHQDSNLTKTPSIKSECTNSIDREDNSNDAASLSKLTKSPSTKRDGTISIDKEDGLSQKTSSIKENNTDNKQETLLKAVRRGDFDAVKKMAPDIDDLSYKDKHGRTILHFGAMNGYHEILNFLLNLDSSRLNVTDKFGKTSLHYAVSSGSIETVKLLMDKKARFQIDSSGKSPLHIAAEENYPDLIKLLIEQGKKFSPKKRKSNKCKLSPFEIAILNGNAEAAKVFEEYELAEAPSIKTKKELSTKSILLYPLHRASIEGDFEVLNYYIDRKASLDVKNIVGFTPLMAAVRYGRIDVVHFLIAKGASLILKDWSYRTCLHIAIKYQRTSILEILLQHAPKYLINSGDKNGRTPLHHAAMFGRVEELKMLLISTSYIKVDHKRISPLHLAAQNGHLQCVKLLLQDNWYKESITDVINTVANDEERSSPIGMAAKGRHNEICKLLIKQGGRVEHLHHFARTEDFVLVLDDLIYEEQKLEGNGMGKSRFGMVAPEIDCLGHLLDCLLRLDELNEMKKEEKKPLVDKKWVGKLIDAFRMEVFEILDGIKIQNLSDNRVVQFLKDDMAKVKGEREDVIMTSLITYSPEVTEYVLDRLIESNSDKQQLRFHYDLLDSPHTHRKTKNAFFAPAVMIETKSTLLHHPIIVKLLESNWIHVHIIMYMTSFVLYAFFCCLITALVIVDKNHQRTSNISTNTSATIYKTSPTNLQEYIPWVTLSICFFQLAKEVIRLFYMRCSYLLQIGNHLENLTYVATLVFMSPFLRENNLISSKNYASDEFTMLRKLKWVSGGIAVFGAWVTQINYFKRYPMFGLYVRMYEEVVFTVVRVIYALIMLLIAFAFSFYVILVERPQFRYYGRAFFRTIMWTFGEFDYESFFIDEKLKHHNVTILIFLIFLLLMPILLMNLLIGLAVGDIDHLRNTSKKRNRRFQIESMDTFRKMFPCFILNRCYKKYEDDNPKSLSLRERFVAWSVDLEEADVELRDTLALLKTVKKEKKVIYPKSFDKTNPPFRRERIQNSVHL